VDQRITVVGAGVVGLSCAIRLAEAGLPVDVLARDFPLETVSLTAGGLWMPFLAEPAAELARWSRMTYQVLHALAGTGLPGLGFPDSRSGGTGPEGAAIGVMMRDGYLLDDEPSPPAWTEGLPEPGVRPAVDPTPKHHRGWALRVPIVDMSLYLPYLVRRLQAAGGTLTRRTLKSLPGRGIVVNSSGLAARALADDPSVYPIRGQVVRVSNPGVYEWLSDDSDLTRVTYVIPHARHIVLGGTAEPGEWSTTPDERVGRQILERAYELVPQLRSASILSHGVGLRPARPSIRLETVRGPERTVIHCYGHGGSGVTVSWGCADDVLAAVRAALSTVP
jgi:D-amino-acid oxidase